MRFILIVVFLCLIIQSEAKKKNIKKEKKQRQVVSDYQEMVYEELASEYKIANQSAGEADED